jgi:peptidoglycan/LPS O-acetylase OafA/YrhL
VSSAAEAVYSQPLISESGQSLVALARWTSAMVVFLAHLRAALFVGWGSLAPADQTMTVRSFYALTSFSHEAVVVFFVLSGFLVGGVNWQRARAGRFDASSYGIDRFTRIYVSFLPAILVTVLADGLGMHLIGWTGFYDGSNVLIAERFQPSFSSKQGIVIALGNLAMLQPVYVPVLGSNIPLWSLSYEVWFYFWFGLLGIAGQRQGNPMVLLAVMALPTIMLGLLFQWLAVYYLFLWCLGILALNWSKWPRWPVIPALGVLGSLALATSGVGVVQVEDYWVRLADIPLAISMAWLLNLAKDSEIKLLRRTARFNHWASDFSYSLYIIHFPIMLLCAGILALLAGQMHDVQRGFLPTEAAGIGVYFCTVCTVVLIAYLYSQLIERRTPQARRWLKAKLLASRES